MTRSKFKPAPWRPVSKYKGPCKCNRCGVEFISEDVRRNRRCVKCEYAVGLVSGIKEVRVVVDK